MSQPDIIVVQHAWRYWSAWSYSVSALFQWPPQCQVKLIVCCTLDDPRAERWLSYYVNHRARPDTVLIEPMWMERTHLLRRGIGRQAACLNNDAAELVMLADADYLPGPDCLDTILETFPSDDVLAYVRRLRTCPHERGDRLIAAASEPGLRKIDFDDFDLPQKLTRAIGGCQIVRADVAREKGYLPADSKWLRPEEVWRRTCEDRVARAHIAGHKGVPLTGPAMLRLRHTKYGRKHIGVEN